LLKSQEKSASYATQLDCFTCFHLTKTGVSKLRPTMAFHPAHETISSSRKDILSQ